MNALRVKNNQPRNTGSDVYKKQRHYKSSEQRTTKAKVTDGARGFWTSQEAG